MEKSGATNPPPCLPNPEDENPLTFEPIGCNRVQPAVTSMEIMDSINSLAPAYGDCVPLLS